MVLQLPQDFTQLFDNELFKFDTNLIPDAVRERTHAHLSFPTAWNAADRGLFAGGTAKTFKDG